MKSAKEMREIANNAETRIINKRVYSIRREIEKSADNNSFSCLVCNDDNGYNYNALLILKNELLENGYKIKGLRRANHIFGTMFFKIKW